MDWLGGGHVTELETYHCLLLLCIDHRNLSRIRLTLTPVLHERTWQLLIWLKTWVRLSDLSRRIYPSEAQRYPVHASPRVVVFVLSGGSVEGMHSVRYMPGAKDWSLKPALYDS